MVWIVLLQDLTPGPTPGPSPGPLVAPSLNEYFNQLQAHFLVPEYAPNLVLAMDSLALKIEGLVRDICAFSGITTFYATKDKQDSMRNKILILSVFIFLSVSATGSFSAEILGTYFPAYEGSHKPIIALYDGAGKYIHLAIYSLTKDEFAESLIRAHKRGAEVKVVIDSRQSLDKNADGETPETAGEEVRRSKGPHSMHNKFAIIDGIIVYTGSYNHTQSATTRNDENYIIIKDKDIAETYGRQFQKLWEKHK